MADARVQRIRPHRRAEVGWNDHVRVGHQGEDFGRRVVLSLSEKTGKRWLASGWRKMCDRFDFLSALDDDAISAFSGAPPALYFNSIQFRVSNSMLSTVHRSPSGLRPQGCNASDISTPPLFPFLSLGGPRFAQI
jgi:hypothetical protein